MVQKTQVNPILLQNTANSGDLDNSKYVVYIKNLCQPNPLIYWTDLTITSLVGNLLILLAVHAESYSSLQIILVVLASFVLYRAAIFVHEVFHVGRQMKGLTLLYNLFYGFLHKFPSYSYAPHRDHHSWRTYGTRQDPEYDILSDDSPAMLLFPILTMLMMPVFATLRYGFLPIVLPFIGNSGRSWVYRYISTPVMNYKYVRPEPTKKDLQEWYPQDAACFVYNAAFFLLMIFNILPWKLLAVWYAVTYGTYLLNVYRVIVSHNYLSRWQATTRKQQILDSLTIPSPVNEFWCPVGLRFHSLHHMYPQIPYHNMSKAHKRLMNALPDNHPYRQTIRKNYFGSVKDLVQRASIRKSLS